MIVEIKPAKATKKEFAEAPFTVNGLIGSQFTIEEKLGMSECPRIKKVPTKDGKKTYDVVALKVSNGMFEKDLHIFDSEWKQLCAVLPDSLISLQGVALKPTRDPNNPLKTRFEYVGVYTQDLNGDKYNSGNPKDTSKPAQGAPGQTNEAPTTIASQIQALHAAIETNINTGIKNTPEKVLEIANKIKVGDGEHLMQAAKDAGWIIEVGGVIRGT